MTDAFVDALRGQGGALAELVDFWPARSDSRAPGPPQLAAAGPRAAGREPAYELLLEMIFEGSCLHYGQPRLVRPENPELALLLGDQLYALGLSRLAALGDLDAVAELADLISLVAQAQAAGDGDLADAVWEAGATAVGWGSSDRLRRAKALARAHDARAVVELRAAAGARRGSAGGGRAGNGPTGVGYPPRDRL
jgi:hypothetical protein